MTKYTKTKYGGEKIGAKDKCTPQETWIPFDRKKLRLFYNNYCNMSHPFSNLLFIKVGYELVKCQILCLICFPKLLHNLEI